MGYIATSNVMCNIPAEKAWDKLRDISTAHHYVPNLKSTKITTTQKEGVGASRRVSGKHGILDETVTEWKEGKGFTIRLHKGDKGPAPFREAHFTYRIDKIDDKQCKLTTTQSDMRRASWICWRFSSTSRLWPTVRSAKLSPFSKRMLPKLYSLAL